MKGGTKSFAPNGRHREHANFYNSTHSTQLGTGGKVLVNDTWRRGKNLRNFRKSLRQNYRTGDNESSTRKKGGGLR